MMLKFIFCFIMLLMQNNVILCEEEQPDLASVEIFGEEDGDDDDQVSVEDKNENEETE